MPECELLLGAVSGNGRDNCLRVLAQEIFSEGSEISMASLDLPLKGVGHDIDSDVRVLHIVHNL